MDTTMRREGAPLCRPTKGGDRAAFSVRVAEAYRDAVGVSDKPAVVLAGEAGVPVKTVHSWIREARLRGVLAAGRQGSVSTTTVAERVAADLGVAVADLEAAIRRHSRWGGIRL